MAGQIRDTIKIEGVEADNNTFLCDITVVDTNGARTIKAKNVELHSGLMDWLITFHLKGKESKVTVCEK